MPTVAKILVLIPMFMLVFGGLLLISKYASERKLSEFGLSMLIGSAILGNVLNYLHMTVAVETLDTIEHAGIECVKQCTIDTTNCHSNWYEIVWKNEAAKAAAMKSSVAKNNK